MTNWLINSRYLPSVRPLLLFEMTQNNSSFRRKYAIKAYPAGIGKLRVDQVIKMPRTGLGE